VNAVIWSQKGRTGPFQAGTLPSQRFIGTFGVLPRQRTPHKLEWHLGRR
jgi:hypothetical protein